MDIVCPNCQALHWLEEWLTHTRAGVYKFGSCCRSGQVSLPLQKRPPQLLLELFTRQHDLTQNFFDNIRSINAALAFTSFGATHMPAQQGGGPYVFKIGGEIYHRAGDLAPAAGTIASYAQLYVYDAHQEAATVRINRVENSSVERTLLRQLTGVLHESHGYAQHYKHAWQRLNGVGVQTVAVVLRQGRNQDPRRYNLPTSNEVALIIPDGAIDKQRDIELHKTRGGVKHMDSWNPAYACLHYVLLFPRGEHGFQRHIPIEAAAWEPGQHPRAALRNRGQDGEGDEEEGEIAGGGRQKRRTISELEYYSYYLFPRETHTADDLPATADTHFSNLFRGGRLFQQYLADIWGNIDQSRLLYLRNHQENLRVELYVGLADAVHNDVMALGAQIGRVIVPSSYYGGQRQMMEAYQDAMAIT
ncbi:hypothetical protein FRC12_014842 [Ceratobasidium sp. 428]|nr:hypothetical protein FRC12_014842 [Ceratobasidium sp. 428]